MKKSAYLLALLAGTAPLAAAHAQSSASAYTSAQRFDEMRRVTGTISPDPDGSGSLHYAATRNTYDSAGRLTKVETGELSSWQSEAVAPLSWSGFTILQTLETSYDAMDRKTKDILSGVPSGGGAATVQTVTQYSYDGDGRLECTAVRMNPAEFASLPSSACTLDTEGSQGPDRITKSLYDAAGQQVQVRRAVGTSIEAADATYSYTDNGRRKFVIDGNGNKAELRYDGHDQQSRWVFPSATMPSAFNDSSPSSALSSAGALNESDYEAYTWDANGNRTSLRNRDGQTIGYSYDVLNRVAVKNLPGSEQDVAYTYDLRGLQTGAAFIGSGEAINSSYDAAGRLTASTSTMGGTNRTSSSLYDANSNRTRLTHPDGFYVQYDYDGLDRATHIRENGAVVGPGVLAAFAYDAAGRRASLTRGDGSVATYAYDGGSRLAELTDNLAGTADDQTISLSYNAGGQIVSRTGSNVLYAFTNYANATASYAVNGLNQYTAAGTTAPTHDARGNMTSDGSASWTYSSENLITWASTGGALVHDPLMRFHQAGGATRFFYDGTDMVFETEATGTPIANRHVFGPGEDEPLVTYMVTSSGTARYFLHADERGSITVATDSNGVRQAARNKYDEYGRYNPPPRFGRYRFTGQAFYGTVGLYYYKARWYHADLGRFLQTDPTGYDDQTNLYAYVGNDPVNWTDPAGRSGIVVNLGRLGYKANKYRRVGGLRRAAREVVRELRTDWNALDDRAKTNVGQKLRAAADLLVGTALYNGPFDVDRDGKIKGGVDTSGVGDAELDDAIDQLKNSIDARKEDNADRPRGNPNSPDPTEKELYRRYQGHKERIAREQQALEELRRRKARLNE